MTQPRYHQSCPTLGNAKFLKSVVWQWILGITIVLSLSSTRLSALPTTSVLIENLVGGGTPAEQALTDADGTTALDAGTADDGDGDLIVLGYFTGSTTEAGFSGNWVPLNGPASANTSLPATTIGDTGSGASGPYGFFTQLLNFDQANEQTFQNTPAVGTRLAVAIYNSNSLAASTHFNVATNDAWQWKAPGILPDLVSINLNAAGTEWFGGAESAGRAAQEIASFPGVTPAARLINISTRGYSGTGDDQLIAGFVLQGTTPKRVLVRVVGPTLEGFGISEFMADPVLQLTEAATGQLVETNDNWADQSNVDDIEAAFGTTGAFELDRSSNDAVLLIDLEPIGGGYTAQTTSAAAEAGVVIAEVYTLDDNPGDTRLINISTRGFVGTGESLLIPGFTVGDGSNRRLLVRVAGPALGQDPFNLPGVLPDPVMEVRAAADSALVASNTNWEDDGQAAAITDASNQVGAFLLPTGTRDAALILETGPNLGYTVVISSETGQTGLVIAEVYELP